jgi:predicted dehydrogenase
MSEPVQVGIIGLGPRYAKHYKPGLLRRGDRFVVRAVCDQVHQRALAEAKLLGCVAARPCELVQRADVEALLLCDPQWYLLWPLELACKYTKPVFCADAFERDDAHAGPLVERIEESRLPVVLAMAPRLAPAAAQLRELCAAQLGEPRLVLCDRTRPLRRAGEAGRRAEGDLLEGIGTSLLDCCAGLLPGEPESVLAMELGGGEFCWLFLKFPGGRGIQVAARRGLGLRPSVRLHVVTAKGSATLELPNRVSWSDGKGEHTLLLPRRLPAVDQLLESFWETVRTGVAPESGAAEAYRILRWLRAARQSATEGRQVMLRP